MRKDAENEPVQPGLELKRVTTPKGWMGRPGSELSQVDKCEGTDIFGRPPLASVSQPLPTVLKHTYSGPLEAYKSHQHKKKVR